MAKKSNRPKKRGGNQFGSERPRPEDRSAPAPAEMTNETHPGVKGSSHSAPGVGAIQAGADVGTEAGGAGRDVRGARNSAPGAQRPGTTEGLAAGAARGGPKSGLGEIEAPGIASQVAMNPAMGGTGAPKPGRSGVRATSDPNFTAKRAAEESEGPGASEADDEMEKAVDEPKRGHAKGRKRS